MAVDHGDVSLWAEKGVFANSLNDAGLSAEGFSKVYTHVVSQMEGEIVAGENFTMANLEGGIINTINTVTDEDGLSILNGDRHGNATNLRVNA